MNTRKNKAYVGEEERVGQREVAERVDERGLERHVARAELRAQHRRPHARPPTAPTQLCAHTGVQLLDYKSAARERKREREREHEWIRRL